MNTYPIEKVLSDYEHSRMDAEMALGHGLQHIEMLYAAQTSAAAERQLLRQRVTALEDLTKRLVAAPENLAALQRTVAQVQIEVERLLAHTGLPLHSQGKQTPAQPR